MIEPREYSDEAIVRQAAGGDRQAFEQVINRHYDLMLRFALKFSGNLHDAEDITHQACINLARGLRHYRFEASFSTFIYQVVLNAGRDYYRRRREDTLDELPETVVHEDNEARVLLRQVLEKVDSLGQGFRETVALVIGEGMTHKEAALVLGIRESTVSWRLHEMRRQLSQFMPEASQ